MRFDLNTYQESIYKGIAQILSLICTNKNIAASHQVDLSPVKYFELPLHYRKIWSLQLYEKTWSLQLY